MAPFNTEVWLTDCPAVRHAVDPRDNVSVSTVKGRSVLADKRRFALGDRVRGKDDEPASFRARVGTVMEIGPGPSEYGVKFDDTLQTEYVQSHWMEELDTLPPAK